jgi:hypothetical protein
MRQETRAREPLTSLFRLSIFFGDDICGSLLSEVDHRPAPPTPPIERRPGTRPPGPPARSLRARKKA